MLEFLLMLLLLVFVSAFSVALGVHLQAAKSKTDCGCGGRTRNSERLMLQRMQRLEQRVIGQPKAMTEGE